MATMAELIEMVRDLPLDQRCPLCKGKGLIDCPAHGSELDEDGWCDVCSTPMDDGEHETTCPCNFD